MATADGSLGGPYITLDDATTRAAAAADPQGFIDRFGHSQWVVIDEVQRVPDLLIAIKRAVDEDRRPGRFLLTGSANVMTIPAMTESLVGRLELIPIWPLAQAEIEGAPSDFIAHVFNKTFPAITTSETTEQITARALRGGYPESLSRLRAARRDTWFGNYITTVVQREITSISAIEDTTAISSAFCAHSQAGPAALEISKHCPSMPPYPHRLSHATSPCYKQRFSFARLTHGRTISTLVS